MFKKALLAKNSISPSSLLLGQDNLLPNAQVSVTDNAVSSSQSTSATDLTSNTSQKRWNQTELGYFDLYFNKVHGEGDVVLIEKDVYYKNMVLFVQCL